MFEPEGTPVDAVLMVGWDAKPSRAGGERR